MLCIMLVPYLIGETDVEIFKYKIQKLTGNYITRKCNGWLTDNNTVVLIESLQNSDITINFESKQILIYISKSFFPKNKRKKN